MTMSTSINPWTDQREMLLKELCAENESYRAIMRRINEDTGATFSRNAILGKVKRLRLSKEPAPSCPKEAKPKAAKPKVKTKKSPLALVSAIPETPYHFLGRTLAENTGCKYPRGGDNLGDRILFCGQPRVPTLTWCANCCNIVFERRHGTVATEKRAEQSRVFG